MRTNRGERGFTLVETMVTVSILGMLATYVLGGIMSSMTSARRAYVRAQAAAWVQSELDFLRVQGYGIATGTRNIPDTTNPANDPATGYLPNYGTLAEPRIPDGFQQAQIVVSDVSGLPLKQLTVRLYETVGGTPYTILSTHVSNFNYP
jgi:prepilin-type N-terminal cleavage/methylation domain-containing protein